MPIVNRSGYRLSIKKHPLWVRILLRPALPEEVVVGQDGDVTSNGHAYRTADWTFEASPDERLTIEAQQDDVAHTRRGTFRVLPLEYTSSTYTGYDLVDVSRDAADAQHQSRQQRGGATSPPLTLRFEGGGKSFKKYVWA